MTNMQANDNTHWYTFDDADTVATEAAQHILKAANQAIAENGRFRIVLAGGRTPEAAFKLLVDADTDWSCWEIYFGDERCLPVDGAERNSLTRQQCISRCCFCTR
jgi:6-phosphogluconolactonase